MGMSALLGKLDMMTQEASTYTEHNFSHQLSFWHYPNVQIKVAGIEKGCLYGQLYKLNFRSHTCSLWWREDEYFEWWWENDLHRNILVPVYIGFTQVYRSYRGIQLISVYRLYRCTTYTGISLILVCSSYRYTVHTGIPLIPSNRSYRYTAYTGISLILVYISYRYTVNSGKPLIPVYRYTVKNTGISIVD